MNNWSDNLIKALEKHVQEDQQSEEMYNSDFFQSLQKYRPIYHFLADVIAAHLKPTSVIDWGCGCGFILEKLKMHGITDLKGIEGSKEVLEFIPENLKENIEIADVLLYKPEKVYDLAITIEVAEHIESRNAAKFVNNICNSSNNMIWWTAAQIGQDGTGHINCQPASYWESIFKEVGLFEPDWEKTYELKQVMLQNQQLALGFPWLRDNFVLWRKI